MSKVMFSFDKPGSDLTCPKRFQTLAPEIRFCKDRSGRFFPTDEEEFCQTWRRPTAVEPFFFPQDPLCQDSCLIAGCFVGVLLLTQRTLARNSCLDLSGRRARLDRNGSAETQRAARSKHCPQFTIATFKRVF